MAEKSWKEIQAEGEAMSEDDKQKAAEEMDKGDFGKERAADNAQATKNASNTAGSGR